MGTEIAIGLFRKTDFFYFRIIAECRTLLDYLQEKKTYHLWSLNKTPLSLIPHIMKLDQTLKV